MRLFVCLLIYLGLSLSHNIMAQDIGASYILKWKQFYPSKSVAEGMQSSIYEFEKRSLAEIDAWLNYNENLLQELSLEGHPYRLRQAINTRLLLAQIDKEIGIWKHQQEHHHSLTLYSTLINSGIQGIVNADFLVAQEVVELVCDRLSGIESLCTAAMNNLQTVEENDLQRGIKQLKECRIFLKTQLLKEIGKNHSTRYCSDIPVRLEHSINHIDQCISFAENTLSPNASPSKPILGKQEFAQRLAWYTDSELTPDQLEQMALAEIKSVRALISEASSNYIAYKYPRINLPDTKEQSIQMAFKEMEKDVPTDAVDYKLFWEDLAAKAIQFIREHNIATLPAIQTLRIESAPESAGPAARIGWVDSAAPFAPNPVTTLYLPSIPDTVPEQEQKDFWSSFNKPFNRMIAIHELFPGHYMQIKQSRETPHPVRLLFPHPVYFEGWATFTERVLLDEGWDADKPLTYLAHLRKRLENANRAYTSIQVHCNNWNQEQVIQFSTETSLVAPQFAKSLWGRIMRSPMQLTTYFYGGKQFSELLEKEKVRQGEDFNLKLFMDTIMKAGPIPIDEFEDIFKHLE